MKIVLFGGSFDPIHKGHTYIAKKALEALEAEQLWYIPVLNNPFDKQKMASGIDRVNMIELAIKEDQRMSVCDIELKKDPNKKSYTYDTIVELKQLYPNHEFCYMMGMDQVEKFHLWHRCDELKDLVRLVAFGREGYEIHHENLQRFNFTRINIEEVDDSSSAIRKGNLESLHTEVLKYISKNGLYLDTMVEKWMKPKRYRHTLSVAKLASEFAESNGLDATKAYVAGLLHDVAKEIDDEKARELMEKYYPEHIHESDFIWHQWLSTYISKTVFLVEDEEVLKAIEDHTTGSTTMSKLGMCVYCADKYDPNRGFDASKEIALCHENILEGFKQCLKDFYVFSTKKNRKINDTFFKIYEKFVVEGKYE